MGLLELGNNHGPGPAIINLAAERLHRDIGQRNLGDAGWSLRIRDEDELVRKVHVLLAQGRKLFVDPQSGLCENSDHVPKIYRSVKLVLEVAAGTGSNLAHYPAGVDIIAVDLSPRMISKARKRGAHKAAVMDAQHLAFRDSSFDTVVSTLGTCTFPDPVEALREMRRVCRPNGHILLLEHGRSSRPGIAAWQDRHAAKWATHLGCWWNREPLESARKAGLEHIIPPPSPLRIIVGTLRA